MFPSTQMYVIISVEARRSKKSTGLGRAAPQSTLQGKLLFGAFPLYERGSDFVALLHSKARSMHPDSRIHNFFTR